MIRPYLQFFRLFGAGITTVAFLVGALTVAAPIAPGVVALLVVAAILTHAWMGGLHELVHQGEDKKNPDYAYKPTVTGSLTKNEMLTALFIVVTAGTLFTAVAFGSLALMALFAWQFCGWLYAAYGKYRTIAYDVVPAIGASFIVLYGAVAVGSPTPLTWVAMACGFFISVYGQWINGLKDVISDSRVGVGSVAVVSGFSASVGLTARSPAFLQLVVTTVALDIVYLVPAVLGWIPPTYAYLFAVLVLPLQVYLIHHIMKPNVNYRMQGVAFVTATLFMASILVFHVIQLWSLAIFVFALAWYFALDAIGAGFSKGTPLKGKVHATPKAYKDG